MKVNVGSNRIVDVSGIKDVAFLKLEILILGNSIDNLESNQIANIKPLAYGKLPILKKLVL